MFSGEKQLIAKYTGTVQVVYSKTIWQGLEGHMRWESHVPLPLWDSLVQWERVGGTGGKEFEGEEWHQPGSACVVWQVLPGLNLK